MEQPDRLTIVERVYHQRPNEDPTQIESRYDRPLKTQEQVYTRHCVATEEWQPIDTGWLGDDVGQIIIKNREGVWDTVNPTDEERKAASAKVLEVAYAPSPGWLIPPRETFRGQPSRASALRIRSRSGECKYIVYAIPE